MSRRRGETPFPMADSATMTGRSSGLRAESRSLRAGESIKIFASLAVRHGIKFGLAGVLSVFIALVAAIARADVGPDHGICDHVRAIRGSGCREVRACALIGTAIGGVIGYLLTARLEQQPVLYLLLVGGVVGFGTAMFGYTKYPYAFLLCALDHDGCREQRDERSELLLEAGTCANRRSQRRCDLGGACLEPHLASVCPKEFLEKMRLALGELRKGLTARSALLFKQSAESIELNDRSFATAIAGLQNLLHFGAMESQYFRARLPTFTEIISCLNRISAAVETLGQTLPEEAVFRRHLRAELEAAHAATADCLGVFADPNADSSRRASALSEVNARCAQWREKLHALRQTDVRCRYSRRASASVLRTRAVHRRGRRATWQTQCAARLASGESPATLPRSSFATLAATRSISGFATA